MATRSDEATMKGSYAPSLPALVSANDFVFPACDAPRSPLCSWIKWTPKERWKASWATPLPGTKSPRTMSTQT